MTSNIDLLKQCRIATEIRTISKGEALKQDAESQWVSMAAEIFGWR